MQEGIFMRVLLINSVCGIGSTGRICTDLAQQFEKDGHEVKIAYGRDGYVPEQFQKYAVRIGTGLEVKLHGIRTRILDEHGFGSVRATKEFLKWADVYDPELLWIHNIHGYYINVELLFAWIKRRPQMQVKWTLHDCWAFTGHCTHFSVAGCEQWKTHCQKCPEKDRYPASKWKDNCKENYERKRKTFTGVKKLLLITPSKWLADLVKQSFLGDYPIEVCYNTIDKNIFKPTSSDFRERYGLQDKKIVLGVASTWDERKGLQDFYKLAKMLDDRYVIVLVGLSAQQMKDLPGNIKGFRRTNSVEELVGIYSTADVFVNPSREEAFGMTTVEAMNCGTPVIVNKQTACEEVVENTANGIAIKAGVENLYKAIIEICAVNKENKIGGGTIIICIPKTSHATELAMLYTVADVFVNPTYEDNYPTVNLEAIACGTMVITYAIGGCAETLQ